jgi:hypothetical protein
MKAQKTTRKTSASDDLIRQLALDLRERMEDTSLKDEMARPRLKYRDAIIRSYGIVPETARLSAFLPGVLFPSGSVIDYLERISSKTGDDENAIKNLQSVWMNALMMATHHLYAIGYFGSKVKRVLEWVTNVRREQGFVIDEQMVRTWREMYVGGIGTNGWFGDHPQAFSSVANASVFAPFLTLLNAGDMLRRDEIALIAKLSRLWWMSPSDPGYGLVGFFTRDHNGLSILAHLINRVSCIGWEKFASEIPGAWRKFVLLDPSIFYFYGQAVAAGDQESAEKYAERLNKIFHAAEKSPAKGNLRETLIAILRASSVDGKLVIQHIPQAANGTTGLLHYFAVRHDLGDLFAGAQILCGADRPVPIAYVLPSLPFGEELEETIAKIPKFISGVVEYGDEVAAQGKKIAYESPPENKWRVQYVEGATRGGPSGECAVLSQLWPAMYFYVSDKLDKSEVDRIVRDPYAKLEEGRDAPHERVTLPSEKPLLGEDMLTSAIIGWAQPWTCNNAVRKVYDALHLLREVIRRFPIETHSANIGEDLAHVALQRLASAASAMPIPSGLDVDYAIGSVSNIGFDPSLIRAMTTEEGFVPAVVAPRFQSIVYALHHAREQAERTDVTPDLRI